MHQVLTPEHAALLFIDIQSGIIDNAHTQPGKTIKLAAKTAVDVASLLHIPVFVSVVPVGPKSPEPVDELAHLPTFVRKGPASLDHEPLAQAIAATGRKTLAIGGIVSEVAVLHGALSAIRQGYGVHILVDACGGLSARTEHAAFRQIEAAGGTLSSVASFYSTLVQDFSTSPGKDMMGLLHGLMAKES